MAKSVDWYPDPRGGQLNLAKVWTGILSGPSGDGGAAKAEAWGIPGSAVEELRTLEGKAAEVFALAGSRETRTAVVNGQVRDAFDALEGKMRDIKRRFFFVPPLTNADLTALGLKVPDRTPQRTGTPSAKVGIEIRTRGLHLLGLRFTYTEGDAGDPANKTRRLWYKVLAPGEKPPVTPDGLTKSVPAGRKYEEIDFEYGDSGKTVYMAVQIENGDRKGPWGPLVSALIP